MCVDASCVPWAVTMNDSPRSSSCDELIGSLDTQELSCTLWMQIWMAVSIIRQCQELMTSLSYHDFLVHNIIIDKISKYT
jgi:hypothetical protein